MDLDHAAYERSGWPIGTWFLGASSNIYSERITKEKKKKIDLPTCKWNFHLFSFTLLLALAFYLNNLHSLSITQCAFAIKFFNCYNFDIGNASYYIERMKERKKQQTLQLLVSLLSLQYGFSFIWLLFFSFLSFFFVERCQTCDCNQKCWYYASTQISCSHNAYAMVFVQFSSSFLYYNA